MRVDVILRHKGNDEAANLLAEYKIGALMVREGDGPITGVLSERDI